MRRVPARVRIAPSILALSALACAIAHAAPRPFVAPFYSYPLAPNAFQAVDVAVADFNGDGRADAAVVGNDAAVSVFGGNLDLTYGPAVPYVAARSQQCVAAGDLNGDGKPDLVVGTLSDSVVVLINNGNGTFKAPVRYVTPGQVFDIAIGDMNGDGKRDVMAVNGNANSVSVWLGTGTGTLGTRADVAVGNLPRSIVLGDLNHDGKLDAFVGASQSTVLLGVGNGTFTKTISTLPLVNAAMGDLNGDGNLDVAAADGSIPGYFDVELGNGDGTFGPIVNYNAPELPVYTALVDVNGDGRPDVVTIETVTGGAPGNGAGKSIALRMNEGGGALGPPHLVTTGRLAGNFACAIPTPGGHVSVFVAGHNSNSLLVHPGNGDSTFTLSPSLDFGPYSSGPVVAVARLTGGPSPDVVASAGGKAFVVLPSTGSPGFGAPISVAGTSLTDIDVADMNGDALPDLVLANSNSGVFGPSTTFGDVLNQGGGSFSAENNYPLQDDGNSPGELVAADFTGDNAVDAVVYASAGPSGPQLVLYPGDGAGGFGAAQVVGAYQPVRMLAADLDGDGKRDIIMLEGSTSPSQITVLAGDGAGGFGAPVHTASIAYPTDLAIGDLNGDGRPDLAITTVSGSISTMLGTSGFGFGTRRDQNLGTTATSVQIADFDADGYPDVVVAHSSDIFSYLHGHGDGSFDDRQDYAGGATIGRPADMNGDGVPDLVLNGIDLPGGMITVVLTNAHVLGVPGPRPVSEDIALAVAPNPARTGLALSWTMAAAGRASLRIVDASGRLVARPWDATTAAGVQRATWMLCATDGRRVAPGVYFAQIITPAGRVTRRFAVLE